MQTKASFIRTIRLWGIFFLIALGAIIVTLDVSGNYRAAQQRAEQMRSDYIEQQRLRVKCEVERVSKLIDYEIARITEERQREVKTRIYEVYAIADNLYQQYRNNKSSAEIRELIIDAIRPIRYDRGEGYFFITGLDGMEHLFADRPDLENTSMLDVQDARGNYVVRDMIDIVKDSGEGFYRYQWTKPHLAGNEYLKISYVKRFEPYDWFIGSGVYLSGVESAMQKIISRHVEDHRFGPKRQGYVFILDLLDINGGKDFAIMYANPNRPDIIGKPISDDLQDAKGKMFRQEFLKGLREQGECFVDYWYKKFDHPEPSPKTSYFKLAGDGRFIVAAGVYLDDVEEKILSMQSRSNAAIKRSVLIFLLAVAAIILTFLLLLNRLSGRLSKDFSLFSDFFTRAAFSSTTIDRDHVRFAELDRMAVSANQMLADKTIAEKAVHDEHERLLVTLHSIVDGVITVDSSGQIELMNRVAEELTGWRQEETVGKDLGDILTVSFSPATAVAPHQSADQTAVLPAFPEGKGVLLSKNGTEYQISMSSAPISDAGGDQRGQVIVFRDETERLRTEDELFKAKKLESVGLLAGGIAHDFNNILAGLFGNIELAKRKLPEEHAASAYLKVAHQALERATGLTKQLLTFAKGGDPLLEAVSLRQVVDNVVQFNLSGSRVKAEIDLPENLWSVKADKGQLGQVIANLTINAKHAMPLGGILRVTAENIPFEAGQGSSAIATDFIKLQLADQGIGMSEDMLDKIFDPYFSTKHSGSGLGLATARSIINKHDGRIEVESQVGEGTVFTLYLPADSARQSGQVDDLPSSEIASISGCRVLIVDDEEIVQDVLREMLTLLGCSAAAVDDGKKGRDLYLTALKGDQSYDLVIMDLTIPGGMGGREATADILVRDPQARVIATSGYSTDPIMANFEQYGFSGRIVKPFQLEDVRRELIRVLGGIVKG